MMKATIKEFATRNLNYEYSTGYGHFTELHIDNYMGVTDATLRDLRGINVLLGGSGAGKTTWLEVAHLLSRFTDTRSALEVLARRRRYAVDFPLLNEMMEHRSAWRIGGNIQAGDNGCAAVSLSQETASHSRTLLADKDVTNLLTCYTYNASVEGATSTVLMPLYSNGYGLYVPIGRRMRLLPSELDTPCATSTATTGEGLSQLYGYRMDDILIDYLSRAFPGVKDIHRGGHAGKWYAAFAGGPTNPRGTVRMDNELPSSLWRMVDIALAVARGREVPVQLDGGCAAPPGVALLDDFETGLCPGTVMHAADMAVSMAEQLGVQLFVTTRWPDVAAIFERAARPGSLTTHVLESKQ